MNPVYLINPPPSPFPLIEPNEDHHQHLQLFSPSSEASSCLSNCIFFNPGHEQGGFCGTEKHQQEEEFNKYVLQGGSSDHHVFLESPLLPTVDDGLNNSLEVSACERDDRDDGNQSNGGSVKWMSSKMRLMRKMKNSYRPGEDKQVQSGQKLQDHRQQPPSSPLDTDNSSNNNSSNNSTVRICSDCNTTKTPLWRSGPRGPKSLCNACGIRQRKARRAMAAAAAAASGAVLVNGTSSIRPKVQQKERRSNKGYAQQYKKRSKLTGPCSRKKLCFEDFTINLSKNLDFHQVFPQDEKEAAILLMALSCGLVHS